MCSAALLLKSPTGEEARGRKPRTKLQQKCLDLQVTLPPITDAQLRFGRKTMEQIGHFVQKGRGGRDSFIWCQECGHMEKVGMSSLYVSVANPTHVCASCGKKLEVKNHHSDSKSVERNHLFAVITTCQDMQIARVFNIHKDNYMGHKTVEHVHDAFTIWFDVEKGKEVIVTRPFYRSYNCFRWNIYDPMKIGRHNGGCSGYYVYDDLYDLNNVYTYPRTKVLPILKRNGWSNKIAKMKASPVELWRAMLTDPDVEGLIKTGQLEVLDYWFSTGGPERDKSQWLPLVKICNRRKYIIKDASLWFDVVKSLEKLGMDTHSPKYICPDDLNAMHDLLQRRIENKKMREELQKLKSNAKNWEEYYAEKKGRFFGIQFNDGNIFCHVIKSVAEMCEEGTRMHHCVYRMDYYKKPESLIISARDRNGDRLETVEVNLSSFQVVQSRGLQNKPTIAHSRIVELVKSNMNLIKKASYGNRKTNPAKAAARHAPLH